MKFARQLPAIYLQWLNYEKERRPDVLYGYPNVIVSYPVSGVGVPSWLAEGTAQYQRQQMGYDYWDSHRDMILRSYVLDNNMLTWNEMGQFSSITSLKAESIYNSGFALVRYISKMYGENKLREITDNLGDLTNFSVDKAIKGAIGKDGNELYEEWKEYLKKDYNAKIKGVKETLVAGDIIEKKGFANYFPHFSPDGKKIAYLSNQDYDYASTGLFVYNIQTKKSEMIAFPVSTDFSWSPDGKKLVYAKRNYPPSIDGVTIYDLYEYNFGTKDEKRLTKELRAYSPAFSSDGKKICFVVNKAGTLNLKISNADGSNISSPTKFNQGEQIYSPGFIENDSKIIFEFSLRDNRKISILNIETGEYSYLFNDEETDTRNPVLSKDGKKLYYASDRTGIFNIYSYNFETKETKQITNELGGAFMPSVDTNNNLVYSSYHSNGYKISLLKNFSEKDTSSLVSYSGTERLVTPKAPADANSLKFDWNGLKNFNDVGVTSLPSKPYNSIFTSLSFFPVIRYDDYSKSGNVLDAIKPGLYLYSDELMNRVSMFGGIAMNRNYERDIFLQFEYDNGVPFLKNFFSKQLGFSPVFSIEGYNVSRKSTGQLIAGTDSITVGVTYDLLALDIGMAFKIVNINHDLKLTYSFNKYASALDGFIIPSSGIFIRGSSQDYFKSNNFSAEYKYESIYPNRHEDINPIGRRVDIRYDYEISKINPAFTVDNNGNLQTLYTTNKLHKLDANWMEAFGLFNNLHSLTFKFRAATIFGPQVDDFYNNYASGLPGMKGYPFYALGGGRLFTSNLTYRFPLFTHIDTRISPVYLDKLYFSVYGDWGNAWDEKDVKIGDFKKDIGAELRLQTFSNYEFPTSIFFNAAYGFDKFTKNFRGENVTYGQEWRFYFGMLFGFDI
jgi:Tol biopolymer transport system component